MVLRRGKYLIKENIILRKKLYIINLIRKTSYEMEQIKNKNNR